MPGVSWLAHNNRGANPFMTAAVAGSRSSPGRLARLISCRRAKLVRSPCLICAANLVDFQRTSSPSAATQPGFLDSMARKLLFIHRHNSKQVEPGRHATVSTLRACNCAISNVIPVVWANDAIDLSIAPEKLPPASGNGAA